MHDIHAIRQNAIAFDQLLWRRNLSEEDRRRFSSEQIISIDERRRAIIRLREEALAHRNALSKEIGLARAKNDPATFKRLMAQVEHDKTAIASMEEEQRQVDNELNNLLAQIPNLPLDDVPEGKDSNDNVEHHRFGAKRHYVFAPKQHFELGEALGQMDFETAAKLSGARFVVLKQGLARLERALGQFMLDVHTSEHGYTEVAPPLLVRDEVMFGTAQLPKFAEDQFAAASIKKIDLQKYFNQGASARDAIIRVLTAYFNGDVRGLNLALASLPEVVKDHKELERQFVEKDFWLIPTAEVPLTNLVRESIVDEAALPLRFTAGTPCFRAEAGAAGKDTRGMIRQHQFDKVELVSITTPEQSKD